MAIRRQLAAWAALAALVAGCQSPPPSQAQGRDVVRPQLGFAIDVPQGWNFRDLSGYVVLELYPQAGGVGRSAPVVQVAAIDRQGVDLEAWADQAIKDSQEFQADLEVVRRAPARLADGRAGLELELKNPRGVRPLIQRMLLTVTDHRAYAVVATVPAAQESQAETAFKKCFATFVAW